MTSIHQQRLKELHKARSERYAWAKRVDPKAVEAFEARTLERLHR